MYCRSYPFLYQGCKVILTLSVTQVGCERTFICKEPFKKSAKRRSLGFPSFDVRRTIRFVTHFEPYDH